MYHGEFLKPQPKSSVFSGKKSGRHLFGGSSRTFLGHKLLLISFALKLDIGKLELRFPPQSKWGNDKRLFAMTTLAMGEAEKELSGPTKLTPPYP